MKPCARVILYALIHGIGAFIISGGIEFAIAYGMYYGDSQPVTLWKFPNTFSGDCALTVFIQCVVTWFIEELLIALDIFNGSWFLARPNPHQKSSSPLNQSEKGNESPAAGTLPSYRRENPASSLSVWAFWYAEIEPFAGSSESSPLRWLPGCKQLQIRNFNRKVMLSGHQIFFWVLNKAIRALLLACIIFMVVWPVAMGIMTTPGHKISGHEYSYGNYPTPQVAKLLYGGVVGLLATPVMAYVIVYRSLESDIS